MTIIWDKCHAELYLHRTLPDISNSDIWPHHISCVFPAPTWGMTEVILSLMQVSIPLCPISYLQNALFLSLEEWSWNINQVSGTPLACITCSHVILSRRSLKKLKLALLKSIVATSLISLLPPRPVVKSTISWSLQLRLLLYNIKFFVNVFYNRVMH